VINLKKIISKGWRFIYQNRPILYSLLLLIIVPAFLFFQTQFLLSSFQDQFDLMLQNWANSIEKLIDVYNQTPFEDSVGLQEEISEIGEEIEEINALTIVVPEENKDSFLILASLAEKEIGEYLTKEDNGLIWRNGSLAWQENRGFATKVKTDSGEIYWLISRPLHNEIGEKTGIINLGFSLAGQEAWIRTIVARSYIFLVVTLIILIILVASNTHLFGYSILYRKLKEVDQMKDDFISIASHELRTPISGLNMFFSMLLEGSYGKITEEARKGLKRSQEAVRSLDRLIEDILNVSRIEQGRLKIDCRPLAPSPIAQKVVLELKDKAEEKGLKLEFIQEQEKISLIKVDDQRLRQAIVNLVGNAIKYTEKGGIKVKITTEGKTVVIAIEDTGIGISAPEIKKLFQKFVRLPSGKRIGASGTGLGLWITHQIVELMKGTIAVESIKDRGSRFTLTFPICLPDKEN